MVNSVPKSIAVGSLVLFAASDAKCMLQGGLSEVSSKSTFKH